MFKLAVLASGEGTTLDNLAHHCYDQDEGMLCGLVEIAGVNITHKAYDLGVREGMTGRQVLELIR